MSLRKLLPSPASLFMFEAAAKHLNFTAAARELNVTQSAVSRMIKRLETHIETSLFKRGPTGLQLTEDGAELFRAVSFGFRTIEAGLEDLKARKGSGRVVTLSISSAFAMHWFVPVADTFQETFPDIDLRFQLVKGEPVGPFEDVDLAVRYNHPANPDQHSWKLMDEIIVPVCSADYLERHGPLSLSNPENPHVLANLSGPMRVPWPFFLDRTGANSLVGARNLIFSDYSLCVQAALKGQAVALGWLHVVGLELQQGGLVRAGLRELSTGFSYDLVASTRKPLSRAATLVRDWLVGEMRVLEHRLSAIP